MDYIIEDLPTSLNPSGFNNSYKDARLKLTGGVPSPSELILQCSSRINLNNVNVNNIDVLFQHSLDGITWEDLTATNINDANFSGDKTLCIYWDNKFTPSAIPNQYIRPIIRYVVNGSMSLPFFEIVSTSLVVMPSSAVAPLINASTYNLGLIEESLDCQTNQTLFSLPMMRKIENPNSPVFNGGNNNFKCAYVSLNGTDQNLGLQRIQLFQSPNPVQQYNIVSSFGIIRNVLNTDNWLVEVVEGVLVYTIPLVFSPLGGGFESANVSINDNVQLLDPNNDLLFNVISLGTNPMAFTFSNYQLTVKAI